MFSFIEFIKVGADLSFLLVLVVDVAQPLQKLDSVVVLDLHERLLRNLKVELVERSLGNQFPQSRVRVLVNEVDCVFETDRREVVAGVSQTPALVRLDEVWNVFDFFGRLQNVVEHRSLDFEVGEVAEIAGAENWLFLFEVAHHEHPVFLHERAHIWIVAAPDDGPDFFIFLRVYDSRALYYPVVTLPCRRRWEHR